MPSGEPALGQTDMGSHPSRSAANVDAAGEEGLEH